jgi:hypothetical protein
MIAVNSFRTVVTAVERVSAGGSWTRGDRPIYAEINDRIVRYSLPAGAVVPQGAPTTVVSGLPLGGADHAPSVPIGASVRD